MSSIKYENSMADIRAFATHHFKTNPGIQRYVRKQTIYSMVLSTIIIAILSVVLKEYALLVMIPVAILISKFVYTRLAFRSFTKNTAKLYEGEAGRGYIGQHILTITDDQLIEESDVSETRTPLSELRIDVTDTHVIIYITQHQVHIIPRNSIDQDGQQFFEQLLRYAETNQKAQ